MQRPCKYAISYLFHSQPHDHEFEAENDRLPAHQAAMRLIELHFADAENSLVMPSAKAAPEEILQQAEVLGITDISVAKV